MSSMRCFNRCFTNKNICLTNLMSKFIRNILNGDEWPKEIKDSWDKRLWAVRRCVLLLSVRKLTALAYDASKWNDWSIFSLSKNKHFTRVIVILMRTKQFHGWRIVKALLVAKLLLGVRECWSFLLRVQIPQSVYNWFPIMVSIVALLTTIVTI